MLVGTWNLGNKSDNQQNPSEKVKKLPLFSPQLGLLGIFSYSRAQLSESSLMI